MTAPDGPLRLVTVSTVIDADTQITVHQPLGVLPFSLYLGAGLASISVGATRADLVRLRDVIDAALAEETT